MLQTTSAVHQPSKMNSKNVEKYSDLRIVISQNTHYRMSQLSREYILSSSHKDRQTSMED